MPPKTPLNSFRVQGRANDMLKHSPNPNFRRAIGTRLGPCKPQRVYWSPNDSGSTARSAIHLTSSQRCRKTDIQRSRWNWLTKTETNATENQLRCVKTAPFGSTLKPAVAFPLYHLVICLSPQRFAKCAVSVLVNLSPLKIKREMAIEFLQHP